MDVHRILASISILLVIGVMVIFSPTNSRSISIPSFRSGDHFPPIHSITPLRGYVSIDDTKCEKIHTIVFFSPRCWHCRNLLKTIDAMNDSLFMHLSVACVSTGTENDTKEMVNALSIDVPIFTGDGEFLSKQYKLTHLPTTFFLSKDSIILDYRVGDITLLSMSRILAAIYQHENR
jgi:thioredoxin-related protein